MITVLTSYNLEKESKAQIVNGYQSQKIRFRILGSYISNIL